MSSVTLTIDDRPVTVAAGTTILQAAGQAGVEIPTLCHVEGLEPSSSCFLCAVEIEGRPVLAPACAMPVAEGMHVRTHSEAVRETRKMAIELLLSDHAGDCIAPCQATCPAGLNIPGFVYPVASGNPRQAVEVIFDRLALPGALGRICPRLCENSCRRCSRDAGLAIGGLHRFAADRDLASGSPVIPEREEASGRRVAIVGAGPAGLAAAFFLLRRGHECTLFDAHPEAGGMLRYGIPEYRLPREALDAEIDIIRRLGAAFRMQVRLGVDFTLADLRSDFDAVFLATGAQLARELGCDGEELALSGLEFLERSSCGRPPEIGDRVFVVGGGNTAMDACRTAVRLGAREVVVLYRRERDDMPCLMEEVEGAEAEGVRLELLCAPTRLVRKDDDRLLVTCVRMQPGEPDASGRRRPVPVPGSEFTVEADTVIAAIGQAVDLDPLRAEEVEVNAWGVAVHPDTLATSVPGVFAGGDAVSGPDLAVRAVAAGRSASVSIDQYLRGARVTGDPRSATVQLRPLDEDEMASIFRGIERSPRARGPEIAMSRRRATFDEIELGFDDELARSEARRCLSCGCQKADDCGLRQLATEYGAEPRRFEGDRRRFERDVSHPSIQYEAGKCILCNACVEVAAEAGEPLGVALVGRGFEARMAVPFDGSLAEGLKLSAERCAEVCPTGALSVHRERACDTCALARVLLPSSPSTRSSPVPGPAPE